ncbi:hypothetical protein FACS18949_13880 [Clostridia bacterium]|nr:hypothetical protein FACS189425_02570 [Clostridia bacterium]GHV35598.1 hypothetical protein FACS18949_13880 [Clostridia bacterium]
MINGFEERAHKDDAEGWIVFSDDSGTNSFEDYLIDEQTKQIAWENVDYCGHCGGIYEGGKHKTVFEKKFDKVCKTIFRFNNPDFETKDNKILLPQRRDNKCWGYNGGRVEIREVVEDAAKRELLEETNLSANSIELFGVFSGQTLHQHFG